MIAVDYTIPAEVELTWSEPDGAYFVRRVGDLDVWIRRMLYNHRVVVTRHADTLSERISNGYMAGWCYPSLVAAIAAVMVWDPASGDKPVGFAKEAHAQDWAEAVELARAVLDGDVGCCTSCKGTGTSSDPSTGGQCWDCRGTGHGHDSACPCTP